MAKTKTTNPTTKGHHAGRTPANKGKRLPVVIQVEGLDVDPGYDHLRIVYRVSPVHMQHYRLRQWVTKPGRLLKAALQRYLQKTGMFRVASHR